VIMPAMDERARTSWWRGLLLVAIILSVVGALWICRQPLIEDEVEFAEIARSYVSSGLPLAHVSGEIAEVLHHPQLYHFLLAVASIAGGPEWGGRLLGLSCLVASSLLAVVLARRLWHDALVGDAAAIMVLLCPLCFRGGLLLDIDNTLLPVVCLGFLTVALRSETSRKRSQIIFLMTLFAIALWTKLTTPVFLLIPLWIMWGKERWKDFLAATAGGVILFVISWATFCLAKGLHPLDPLWHLVGKGSSVFQSGTGNVVWELVKRLVRIVLWLSPFLVGLLLVRQSEVRNKRILLALGSFVVINLSFYWIVGGDAFGFPRYQVPATTVLIILLAPAVLTGWDIIGNNLWVRGLLFLGSVVFFRVLAGDVLFQFYAYPEQAAVEIANVEDMLDHLVRVALPVVVFAGLVMILWWRRLGSVRLGIATICALILLPWWVSQDLCIAGASYNTAYLYGEAGIKQAATLLRTFVPDGAQIVASKDVAFHTGYHFPHRVLGAVCEHQDLAAVLDDSHVQALVYRDGQWIDAVTGPCLQSETVQRELREAFYQFQTGSFHVWIERRNLGFREEPEP